MDTVVAYLAANPAAYMGQLLQRPRCQGTTVVHTTAGIPGYSCRHAPLGGASNKRSTSSVVFPGEPVADADEGGLLYADEYFVPMEEIPTSTDVGRADSAGAADGPIDATVVTSDVPASSSSLSD